MIITISRQFGSGGRELAYKLAEKLGYAIYDKHVIEEIAKETSLDEHYIEKILASPQPSPYISGYTLSYSIMHKHTNDILLMQQKIMSKLAKNNNAIFVGRGAELYLKEYNPFKIFVYTTMEKRLERTLANAREHEDKNPKAMEKKIKRIDKERIKTCKLLGFKWGRKENYDLCVSTEKISPSHLAEILYEYIKKMEI